MQRIKKLQKLLASKKYCAFLITHRPNLKYLCNFRGTRGICLVTPRKAFFSTDARYFEEAKKNLPAGIKIIQLEKFSKSIKTKYLYFEEQYLTIAQLKYYKKLMAGVKFRGAQNLVENLRMIKEPMEIKYTVIAQKIAEKVLRKIVAGLREGATEKETMILIKKLGYEFGADEISFRPVVAFGKNSSVPHHEPGNRRLKKGDIVLIDMGMKYAGYCSDMTRVFFFKKPPTFAQKKIYNLVLEAQEKIITGLRAGISGKRADSLARKFLERAGFAEKFLHNSGHGIGLEIHEIPTLGQTYKNKLPAGAIVTAEPGIYIENSFGVRIEDMVILDSRGARNLTHFPKNLSSAIIRPLRNGTGPCN